MAMAIEGKSRHYRWGDIRGRHWIETAKICGLTGMREIIGETLDRTPGVIERVRGTIPVSFPARIADTILDGVQSTAECLKAEWPFSA
jgi:serine/threonine-protein kinase HipA